METFDPVEQTVGELKKAVLDALILSGLTTYQCNRALLEVVAEALNPDLSNNDMISTVDDAYAVLSDLIDE